MEITVLGTASIGGVPEWDCPCPNCASARADANLRRTRASITISLDGGKHVLIDAGHDLKTQLEARGLTPREDVVDANFRESRIDSIFLTHGHADHTAGIAEFCTGKSFEIPVYGPSDLIDFLFGTEKSPNYFGALGRLAKNYVIPIKLEENETITRLEGTKVTGFEVKHTQVLEDGSRYPSSTFAYEISNGGKRIIYAPDIGRLDESLLNRLEGADVFMMDATFWWDNELERISGIPVTSYQLGHVPQEEATKILEDLDIGRVIFTHFNHTNPVLNPESRFREIVEVAGQELAYDGMIIEI
ncbi:MBL fold metallo-hydrolase [Candidatus Bathyarchaeota archaeon]|nr:MBL fold metallo-hydrolase [Candidatus Bathyarchaeota archaeon]